MGHVPQEPSRFVFPHNANLGNKAFSESVRLTVHAWERFCGRYIEVVFAAQAAPLGQRFFLGKMRECFRRAQRKELPQHIIDDRHANNNNRAFLYLQDPVTKLGFVVSNDFRRPATLITVDPAPSKTRLV